MIVLTGDMEPEDVVDMNECLSELLLEEAEEERRKEVRRLCGENREVIWWKREECMIVTWISN